MYCSEPVTSLYASQRGGKKNAELFSYRGAHRGGRAGQAGRKAIPGIWYVIWETKFKHGSTFFGVTRVSTAPTTCLEKKT